MKSSQVKKRRKESNAETRTETKNSMYEKKTENIVRRKEMHARQDETTTKPQTQTRNRKNIYEENRAKRNKMRKKKKKWRCIANCELQKMKNEKKMCAI